MPWYYGCRVVGAGPDSNNDINIYIDGGSQFPPTWFKAPDSMKGEMLATALAAITTGLTVWVGVDSPTQYSTLRNLYIVT